MINYSKEFKEYTKLIEKKILRDIISHHYSNNEIKLGLLLSCCETSNGKIKNWLLSVHKACKLSKFNLNKNSYLSMFKLKLSKISERLLNEIKEGRFNREKLKKFAFIKKNSKSLPHDIQQLISEISCFISETIDEDSINIISHGLINENCIIKRKRFSRQIKDSLTKYCREFNSFTDPQESLFEITNVIDELIEVQQYFSKYDATLPNNNYDKLSAMELFLTDDISKIDFIRSKENINEKGKIVECEVDDNMDYEDFNIVDEWNEDSQDQCLERVLNNNFLNDVIEKLNIFFTKTNNDIINDIKSFKKTERNQFSLNMENVISTSFEVVTENQSVSNIQQSYFADIKSKLNSVLKLKSVTKLSLVESDAENDILRNKMLCTKPKPFIKFLSLKKPNVYIDNTIGDKEAFLKNIPLPDTIKENDDQTCKSEMNEGFLTEVEEKLKTKIVELFINQVEDVLLKEIEKTLLKNTKETLIKQLETTLLMQSPINEAEITLIKKSIEIKEVESCINNEDYDNKVEETIPESILDFSEVLIDYFECDGNEDALKESLQNNSLSSTQLIVANDMLNDDVTADIAVTTNTPNDGVKADVTFNQEDMHIIHNNNVSIHNNDQDSFPRFRSNYSVYSPEKYNSNGPREFYNYESDNSFNQENFPRYEYSPRNYYESNNYYCNNNNNQRNLERSSQRFHRHFISYNSHCNESRQLPYHHSRYRSGNYH